MPVFADSHVHLADPAFDEDRDKVITAARQAGAQALVCIGESLGAAERAEAISKAHAGLVWYTVGVHPHDATTFDMRHDLLRIGEHLDRGAVAIGECGLDYHYENSPQDVQRDVFAAQIKLAAETGKPLVVHSRDAVEDTAAMVREAGESGVRGVMHCFTGPASLAEVALTAGWYVSFAGVITFKKWADDGLIRSIPADRTLVESDAPYLAPVPFRGKRNEPAHVALTLARVAAARELDVETMGEIVVANTQQLFGLAGATPHP